MKIKKTLATIIALLLTFIFALSLELNVEAVKKTKLSTPDVIYIWVGDNLVFYWSAVDNASSYEVMFDGEKITVKKDEPLICFFDKDMLTYKNGKYYVDVSVTAIPSNTSKYSKSSAYTLKGDVEEFSADTCASNEEALSLTKEELVNYLDNNRINYFEKDAGSYVIVQIALKNSKNQETLLDNGLFVPIDGVKYPVATKKLKNIKGFASDMFDKLEKIDLDSTGGVSLTTIVDEVIDENSKKKVSSDQCVYLTYYYLKDFTSFPAYIYTVDYMQKDNKTPSEIYEDWEYYDEYDLYNMEGPTSKNEYLFEISEYGSGKEKRYVCTFYSLDVLVMQAN